MLMMLALGGAAGRLKRSTNTLRAVLVAVNTNVGRICTV